MEQRKCISGRPATEDDLKDGTAIFYIRKSASSAYDLWRELPADGRFMGDMEGIPVGTAVQVVQAEIVEEKIYVGFIYSDGKEAVCTLEEIEFC